MGEDFYYLPSFRRDALRKNVDRPRCTRRPTISLGPIWIGEICSSRRPNNNTKLVAHSAGRSLT